MRPSGRFSFHTPNYIPLRHAVWPPRVSNAIGSGGLAPSRLRTYCTVSERVEIGKALEGELAAKALQRMKSGIENPEENFPQGRVGNPELRPIGEKIPELPQGRTRDIAAKAAGFGNGKTYATRLHSNSISRLALLTLAIDSIS